MRFITSPGPVRVQSAFYNVPVPIAQMSHLLFMMKTCFLRLFDKCLFYWAIVVTAASPSPALEAKWKGTSQGHVGHVQRLA